MKRYKQNIRYPDGTHPSQPKMADAYREFDATELYCPRCKQAVPVRKRLLLVLPDGDKYEYLCALCATSIGNKVVRGGEQIRLII